MIDVIYKIKNSQPTIVGEEAQRFFAAIVNSGWVIASSALLGKDEMLFRINTFINEQARIELHGQMLYTLQPIHIIYLDEKQLNDGWKKTWILLYSNGAVCLSEKEDGSEPFLLLFMDESLADPSDVVQIPLGDDGQ